MDGKVRFDILLNAALQESMARDIQAFRQGPQPELSSTLDSQLQKDVHKAHSKKRAIKLGRAVKAVAACLVLALALSAAVFAPVQAVQAAVASTVLEWRDKFTRYIFSADDPQYLPEQIEFAYIPEGFELQESFPGSTTADFYYHDGNHFLIISLLSYNMSGNFSIDNEYSYHMAATASDGTEYFIVTRDEVSILIYNGEDYVVVIDTDVSLHFAITILNENFL